MPRAPRSLLVAALAAGLLASRGAAAVVVERIVAVVGDKPILLSELRRRARPYLVQIAMKVPPGAQQAAAESQMMKEVVAKVVDEELEGQAAERAQVRVGTDEVEAALKNIAAMQGATVEQILKDASSRMHMSEAEYREEIRRQMLEGKMVQLRVRGRVRITEEDLRAAFERTLREDRKRREYNPAWIVLRLLPGSSAEAIAEREALARELIARVAKGEDFAELAKTYSDDSSTRELGGDLGIRAPLGTQAAVTGKRQTLAQELEGPVMALEQGQLTAPIRVGPAIVVLKLVERQPSRYTTYEAAKAEMFQRLQNDILDKAKRRWLDELKTRTHVDVRL